MIVDTSLLIAAERGAVRLDALLASRGNEPVAIAAITASELLHGCHRAADPGVRARRSAFVEAVLAIIPVVPFGLIEARRHAQLWADMFREGTMIGPHDLLIAATATAHGHAIATLNERKFRRVPGLHVVSLNPFTA